MTMPSDEYGIKNEKVWIDNKRGLRRHRMVCASEFADSTPFVRADIHEALVKERDKYKRALNKISRTYKTTATETYQEMERIAQQALGE